MSNAGRLRALDDILKERDNQDAQWGGPAHDDTHSMFDWVDYIDKQVCLVDCGSWEKERLVKIAALALAALEAINRKEQA